MANKCPAYQIYIFIIFCITSENNSKQREMGYREGREKDSKTEKLLFAMCLPLWMFC